MAGISSKAAGRIENKIKFNSYEQNSDFDINIGESFFRVHDPQIGRWFQIDPKSEKYFCLTPYSTMSDNPVLIFDPLGDDLEVIGKKKNVDEAIAEMNRILDGFYTVTTEKGKVKVTKTEKAGEMSDQTKGFFSVLNSIATNPNGTATIEVVRKSGSVDIDSWNNKKMDIADVKKFGDGKYMSSASVMAHILAEQESLQIDNKGYIGKTVSDFATAYERDHGKAKDAEEIVTGYGRSSWELDGTNRNFAGNTTGNYIFNYYKKIENTHEYEKHSVTVKFKNGNVKKVTSQ